MRITAAEAEVMQALWAHGPAGAEEILSQVGEAQGWSLATVRTLVHRLIKKGALRSERRGGRTAYVPLVAREEYVAQESQGLIDRLFGGQVAPLVAQLAARRALSAEDVARLKRLVAGLDAEEDD
jgi:BlaI family transcriptional regulator, penicillinase repressor